MVPHGFDCGGSFGGFDFGGHVDVGRSKRCGTVRVVERSVVVEDAEGLGGRGRKGSAAARSKAGYMREGVGLSICKTLAAAG